MLANLQSCHGRILLSLNPLNPLLNSLWVLLLFGWRNHMLSTVDCTALKWNGSCVFHSHVKTFLTLLYGFDHWLILRYQRGWTKSCIADLPRSRNENVWDRPPFRGRGNFFPGGGALPVMRPLSKFSDSCLHSCCRTEEIKFSIKPITSKPIQILQNKIQNAINQTHVCIRYQCCQPRVY